MTEREFIDKIKTEKQWTQEMFLYASIVECMAKVTHNKTKRIREFAKVEKKMAYMKQTDEAGYNGLFDMLDVLNGATDLVEPLLHMPLRELQAMNDALIFAKELYTDENSSKVVLLLEKAYGNDETLANIARDDMKQILYALAYLRGYFNAMLSVLWEPTTDAIKSFDKYSDEIKKDFDRIAKNVNACCNIMQKAHGERQIKSLFVPFLQPGEGEEIENNVAVDFRMGEVIAENIERIVINARYNMTSHEE